MTAPAIERFDGAHAWSKLPPAVQVNIGALALEFVVSWHAIDVDRPFDDKRAVQRAADAAHNLVLNLLMDVANRALGTVISDGVARIPVTLGAICRDCGCSEHDACQTSDGPCAWAEPDLCTACVGRSA